MMSTMAPLQCGLVLDQRQPDVASRTLPSDSVTLAATPILTGDAGLEGDIRKVSVVMADLRGFTAFCEGVPLGLISRVLNDYLTAMIDAILGQQGRVQDFVGDGILGVFGAPGHDPDHGLPAQPEAGRGLGRRGSIPPHLESVRCDPLQ